MGCDWDLALLCGQAPGSWPTLVSSLWWRAPPRAVMHSRHTLSTGRESLGLGAPGRVAQLVFRLQVQGEHQGDHQGRPTVAVWRMGTHPALR